MASNLSRATSLAGLARAVVAAAALASATLAMAAPMVCDGVISDAGRDRTIPVRVRLPDGATAARPAPVIVFSHGLGGSVDGGTWWGQAWSNAGFAVVHVQHPGSDIEVWRSAPDAAARFAALRAAANGEQLIARVADMRYVIGRIGQPETIGACSLQATDPARIGAAGHSFGAVTMMALAGQRYGRSQPGIDRRIKSFVVLSPNAARRGAENPNDAFRDIAAPMFLLTGTADGDPFSTAPLAEQAAARAAVFELLSPSNKALLVLAGADHQAFGGGGRSQAGPAAQEREARREGIDTRAAPIIADTTTRWFRQTLAGEAGAFDAAAITRSLGPDDRLAMK
jgi:predicted dienelactone hydrolase